MDGKALRISELNFKDAQKAMLTFLLQPRSIAEVAAKFDKSYSYTSQNMSVMKAKGFLVRCRSLGGSVKWRINSKELIA